MATKKTKKICADSGPDLHSRNIVADSAPIESITPPSERRISALPHLQQKNADSMGSSASDSGYYSVTSSEGSSFSGSLTESISGKSSCKTTSSGFTSELTNQFTNLRLSSSETEALAQSKSEALDSGLGSFGTSSSSDSHKKISEYTQPSDSSCDKEFEFDNCVSQSDSQILVENKSLDVENITPFTQDYAGDTLAHYYLYHNNENAIDYVIKKTPHPNYLDTANDLGQTLITIAGIASLFRTLRKLVLAGADFLQQDFKGNTVLHKCVINGDIDCVRALVRKISWDEYNEQAKFMSYKLKTLPLVPSGVNKFNDEGFAPIHLAVIGGHHEIIHELWEAGADVNIKSKKNGDRPIHLAIRTGDLGTIQLLVNDCNVDMNLGNFNNTSPITLANSFRRMDIVEFLVEAGVDTTDLFTPIEYYDNDHEDMDIDFSSS